MRGFTTVQIGTPPAGFYDGILMRANPSLHEEAFNLLRRFSRSGASAIDVGSGQGAFAARLRDNGYPVVAVDKNPDDFRAHGVSFIALDFDDAKQVEAFMRDHRGVYDVAVGMEVIEHVENPWEYFRFLLSLIKPGGIVLLTTPNAESIYSRIDFLFTGLFAHFTKADLTGSGHINPLTFHELHIIAEAVDAETLEARALCPLPWIVVSRRLSVVLKSIFAAVFRPFLGSRARGDIICFILKKSS